MAAPSMAPNRVPTRRPRWLTPVLAVAAGLPAGCTPRPASGSSAYRPPEGRRRRGLPDDRPHPGRADRDHAGPPGGLRAVAARKRSEAQLEADRASPDQARADYDSIILAAEADVAAARSAVRDAEIDLGHRRMTSPIDGRQAWPR